VGHDRLELVRLEGLHQPGGGAHGRVLGRAAHRERVRHGRVGNGDLRLGEVGLDAEPLDHRVEAGRLLRRDLLRAHGGEADLVRQEQLPEEQGARDDDDRDGARAGGEQDTDQGHVKKAQQEHREEHPGLKPGVASQFHSLSCHLQERL
jgi:hypothetical protein